MAARIYDPQRDNIRSILVDVCYFLNNKSEFIISGCGQERWPARVYIDLSILLEQLPDILYGIHRKENFSIDFYEQNIQREVIFSYTPDKYVVTYKNKIDSALEPGTEKITRYALERMLLELRDAFMSALAEVSPGLEKHPWTQKWFNSTVASMWGGYTI